MATSRDFTVQNPLCVSERYINGSAATREWQCHSLLAALWGRHFFGMQEALRKCSNFLINKLRMVTLVEFRRVPAAAVHSRPWITITMARMNHKQVAHRCTSARLF